MSSDTPEPGSGGKGGSPCGTSSASAAAGKQKEKARVSRTSLILWHAHQNDAAAVRKLLEEDRSLVNARDYDSRTPLHVASLHGWVDVAKCLLEFGADVNAQDRWKNTVCRLLYIYVCVCGNGCLSERSIDRLREFVCLTFSEMTASGRCGRSQETCHD